MERGAFLLTLLLIGACTVNPAPRLPEGQQIRVIMDEDVKTHLAEVGRYFDKESAFCLHGAVTEHIVAISTLRLARMEERDSTQVVSWECGESDFLGVAHNHPNRQGCEISAKDQRSLDVSPRKLMVVVASRGCIRVRLKNGQDTIFPNEESSGT